MGIGLLCISSYGNTCGPGVEEGLMTTSGYGDVDLKTWPVEEYSNGRGVGDAYEANEGSGGAFNISTGSIP